MRRGEEARKERRCISLPNRNTESLRAGTCASSLALAQTGHVTEVVLTAFGNDVAHSAESSVAAKYRGWKERRERHMIKAIDNILAGNAAKANPRAGSGVDSDVANIRERSVELTLKAPQPVPALYRK